MILEQKGKQHADARRADPRVAALGQRSDGDGRNSQRGVAGALFYAGRNAACQTAQHRRPHDGRRAADFDRQPLDDQHQGGGDGFFGAGQLVGPALQAGAGRFPGRRAGGRVRQPAQAVESWRIF